MPEILRGKELVELGNANILNELQLLKRQITDLGSIVKSSTWSAHADWASSSSNLAGNINLSTQLGKDAATTKDQLDAVIRDSSSERFLEIAKELSSIIS